MFSGEVFTWGHNRVGQLGRIDCPGLVRNAEGALYLPTPQLVPNAPEDVVEVCEGNANAVVCLFLTLHPHIPCVLRVIFL
jgi:Regulator of chromosome condensation (RCC1) repeat